MVDSIEMKEWQAKQNHTLLQKNFQKMHSWVYKYKTFCGHKFPNLKKCTYLIVFHFLAHFGCYRYQSEVNSTIIRGIITSSMCLEVAQQQLLQLPLASSQYRDPCHGSDPIVAAAARFRTHFITLCFVYRVKVSNSTTSIPFDASWWLNDTDSSLQQFVNMRWYYVLYCTNTYNNHTRKWKYFRWFIYLQKSNEILYSMLK